jgi:phenylacetic acid degradation protein
VPQVYAIDGLIPVVDPAAFVHPSAVLIGDVHIGTGTYVGPGAALRGDFGRIVVGRGASVQDNCVMHGYPDKDTVIEDEAQIGHGAVVHGCRIGRGALVGMNAVVNDNAEVGESAVVAAMAFVKAAMVVPARTLVAGIPARIVRALTDTELAWKAQGTALYQDLTRRSLAGMVRTEALTQAEPGRARIRIEGVRPLSELKGASRS